MSWQRKESKVKVQNLWMKVRFIWILFLECVLGILELACECFCFFLQAVSCHAFSQNTCKIRLQWAAVLFCLFVFLCNVVFVFLVIISLLEVMQILTSNSRYLLNSQTLSTCLKVLLSLKKHMYINVYKYTRILTIWNIDIGIDIIRSKWESSENESSLFSGELPSKGLFLGPYLTMRCL